MDNKKLSICDFETPKGNTYIFDNAKGIVIVSNSSKKYIIENFSKGEEILINDLEEKFNLNPQKALLEYKYIYNLIQNGHFYVQKEIKKQESYKDLILNSPASQLILIVTEACNLRCKYCIYSDNYPDQKTYTSKKMNFTVAKKAIDEYMKVFQLKKHKGLRKKPLISFYGGEPLLEYKLIKQVIEYCEENKFEANYSLTTNGTLMNSEILDMLAKYDVGITFSLDGYKENHNRNRVFLNEDETFDLVLQNFKALDLKNKQYGNSKPLGFVCCFDSYSNMEKIVSFFENIINNTNKYNVMFNQIYKYNTDYYEYCDKRHEIGEIKENNDTFKLTLEKLKDKYLNNEINEVEQSIVSQFLFQFYPFLKYRAQGEIGCTGAACAPGDKIAVDGEGIFYVCEKASQQYPIGNIEEGLNWEKASKLLCDFIDIRNSHCKNCSVSRLCELCYVHLIKDSTLKFDEQFCSDRKEALINGLKTLYSTLEENENAFSLIDKN